ncbi:DUF6597 domain-containing transcriptional factor [Microbacterium sp. PMB16]|uniref:DUF6597 domain-containing transcriptional factor n=1 Tax=Microbacterium sp. PMB16 TaxID=3120157 RepID=UPI003F4B276E
MIYQERAVPEGLEQAISRLWFLETPRQRPYEKILPLPFVHLIVNLSDPYSLYDRDGQATVVSAAFLSGIQTEYLVIESPPLIRHVGVELRPEGLAALTPAHGAQVAHRVQDVSAVVPGIDGLVADLRGAESPDAALTVLSDFVVGRAAGWQPDAVVQQALIALRDEPERLIGDLARAAGVSHRTLITRFRGATGLTPKEFAQVDRFHRFLAAAMADAAPDAVAAPDWAALVGASDYYDQPHVIRAFRRFCGWTPTEYHRRIAEFGPDAAHFVPLDEVPAAADQARS